MQGLSQGRGGAERCELHKRGEMLFHNRSCLTSFYGQQQVQIESRQDKGALHAIMQGPLYECSINPARGAPLTYASMVRQNAHDLDVTFLNSSPAHRHPP